MRSRTSSDSSTSGSTSPRSSASSYECAFVKMHEVFAKTPAEAAHAEVHLQTGPLPERKLPVQRFGNSAWLRRVLMPTAFHTIRQLQTSPVEKDPKIRRGNLHFLTDYLCRLIVHFAEHENIRLAGRQGIETRA